MTEQNTSETAASSLTTPTLQEFEQLSSTVYDVSVANELTITQDALAAAAYAERLGDLPPFTEPPPVRINAPPGFTLLKMSALEETGDGFAAAAFQDANGNIIIAFEGTVPGIIDAYSRGTIGADALLGQGKNSAALDDARDFAQRIYDTYANGGKIYVTGHSLGGAEAEAACQTLGVSRCAGGATFAAPGLPGNAQNDGSDSGLTDFVEYGDPIANFSTDSTSILKHVVFLSAGNRSIEHYGRVVFVGKPDSASLLLIGDDKAKELSQLAFRNTVSGNFDNIIGQGFSIITDLFGSNLKYHNLSQYVKDISSSGSSLFVPISGDNSNLGLDYAILPLNSHLGPVDSYTQLVDGSGNITELATEGSNRFIYLDGQNQTVNAGGDTRDFIFSGLDGTATINGRLTGTPDDGIVDVLGAGPGDQNTGDAVIDGATPTTVINANGGSNILIGSKGKTEFNIGGSMAEGEGSFGIGTNVIYGGGGTSKIKLTGDGFRIVAIHVDNPSFSSLTNIDIQKLTDEVKKRDGMADNFDDGQKLIILINPTKNDSIFLNDVRLTGASYQKIGEDRNDGEVTSLSYDTDDRYDVGTHIRGFNTYYQMIDQMFFAYKGNDGQTYTPSYNSMNKISMLRINDNFESMFGVTIDNFTNNLAGINIDGDGPSVQTHDIFKLYDVLSGDGQYKLRYDKLNYGYFPPIDPTVAGFTGRHTADTVGPYYYYYVKPSADDKFQLITDKTSDNGNLLDQSFFTTGGPPTIDLATVQVDQPTEINSGTSTVADMTSANFTGNGNQITVGNGSTLTLSGVMNGVTEQGDGSTITLMGSQSMAVVTGDNNKLVVTGADGQATISGQNDTLQTLGSGTADVTASGDGQTLTLGHETNHLVLQGAGGFVTLTQGDGDVTLNGAGDTLIVKGTGTVNAGITGDNATFYGDRGITTVSVNGSSGQFYAGAGTTAITVGGNNNSLFGGVGPDTLTVEGEDNQLIAGDGASNLTANGSNNSLVAGSGDDNLTAINGTGNLLTGGAGADTLLVGGDGNRLVAGSGATRLIASGSGNILLGGAGTDSLTAEGNGNRLTAGSGDADLTANGSNNQLFAGSGDDSLTAINGSGNVLTGGAGSDTLSVDGMNDTLIAGTGTSRLVANDGGNHFVYGGGTASILSGDAGNGTASNDLTLSNGLSEMDLWFMRTGNDLVIDRLGHTDALTVTNYFGSAGNSLSTIMTADHVTLTSPDVLQLVQAMAAFGADHPAFDVTTATAFPNDPTLLQTLATAHH